MFEKYDEDKKCPSLPFYSICFLADFYCLWPGTFFLVSLFAISAVFRAASDSASLTKSCKVIIIIIIITIIVIIIIVIVIILLILISWIVIIMILGFMVWC